MCTKQKDVLDESTLPKSARAICLDLQVIQTNPLTSKRSCTWPLSLSKAFKSDCRKRKGQRDKENSSECQPLSGLLIQTEPFVEISLPATFGRVFSCRRTRPPTRCSFATPPTIRSWFGSIDWWWWWLVVVGSISNGGNTQG